MKRSLLPIFFCFFIMPLAVKAQEAISPAVPGFGAIYQIENPDMSPDTSLTYKIVIDVTIGSASPKEVNFALNNIARMFNLHVASGVPKENMDIIAVVHSKAAVNMLNDKAYKRINKVKNPNKDLISALSKAGVNIYVCGQSLIVRGFDSKELHPDVDISVSALTILTEYQLKGYALLKF